MSTDETTNNIRKQIQLADTPTAGNEVADRSESTISKSHPGHATFTPSTALQNKPHYRIDPDRWYGLFRGYVRQDWHTVNVEDGVDELRAHWNELFFDLIYVACIVHLSSEAAASISHDSSHRRLAGSASTHGSCEDQWQYSFILTAFAQFGMLTNAWKAHVFLVSHFVFNQWMDRVLNVAYMLCILTMGIFIQDDESYEKGFLISYAWLQVATLLLYVKALLIPRAKTHALFYIGQSLFFIIIAVIIAAAANGLCAIHYFGIYVALFCLEFLSVYIAYRVLNQCKPIFAIPINVPHLSERYGLFIMLILGESIITVMSADIGKLNLKDRINFQTMNETGAPSQVLILWVVMTFLLSYFIARLYYDCQPPEEMIMRGDNNHALRKSKTSARLYLQAHQLLFFGLLGLGMGIKITGKHLSDLKRRWIDVILPAYALVVIIIALNMIRIAHPYNIKDNHGRILHWKVWSLRALLLLIMIVMPLTAKVLNQFVGFMIIFACVVLQLCVDVEGKERMKVEKQEMKEKRELAKQETEEHRGTHRNHFRAKMMKRMASGVGKI